MLNQEFSYKINSILEICKLHDHRMNYALNYVVDIFPIDSKSYDQLSDEMISHMDQLIYRFSQLQDTLGTKLFPVILEGLGEHSMNVPFIDLLNQLEKLNILDSSNKWMHLREIRNLVTHEYPDNQQEIIEALNELCRLVKYLSNSLASITSYLQARGWV